MNQQPMNQQPMQVNVSVDEVLVTMKNITGKPGDFSPMERGVVELILLAQMATGIVMQEKMATASIMQNLQHLR